MSDCVFAQQLDHCLHFFGCEFEGGTKSFFSLECFFSISFFDSDPAGYASAMHAKKMSNIVYGLALFVKLYGSVTVMFQDFMWKRTAIRIRHSRNTTPNYLNMSHKPRSYPYINKKVSTLPYH